MPYTLGPFTVDQLDFISSVPISLLAAVAAGRFDLNQLAREELASRGHDQTGLWVGIARAHQSLQEWNTFALENSRMLTSGDPTLKSHSDGPVPLSD